ncbi:MAG: hypothetical protein ACRDSJ_13205 [Rubrobacteraceae bacterium]
MTDNPQDRPEERRRTGRTGPLGEDPEESRERPEDEGATRQIPADETRRGGALPRETASEEETRQDETGRDGRSLQEDEEKETRVIRTPGAERRSAGRGDTGAYPRGYFEAAEEREDRLRDMYGGLDWLASFLGFVFAGVAGAVLFLLLSLVVVPFGVSIQVGGELGPAQITALVLLGVLIFLTFLFGGYVAGRLARFDGGRNGAMSAVWALILVVAGLIIASFLPGSVGESMRDFIQGSVMPLAGQVRDLGVIGAVVAAVAVLIAILGGIVGGRLGGRYHAEIDRTT